ncbi:glycosyl hydrolase family 95 catalytic domain-containing protein [Stieleria neptunia]|uniref:glycosyl hydrolase family 95 catalytic domain-containing protein n=1 Tax=Stieleria neptunia TaxID=2527979 RepID=UPI0011A60478|nr:hypothetical protein [Stieleria neptunia]
MALKTTKAQSAPIAPIQAATDAVDWNETLSRFNPRWDRMPNRWDEAPFLGNGEQGTQVYQTGPRTLHFGVGCSAAHDHRPPARDDLNEKHVEVLNRGRHFIGHLELHTSAPLIAGTAELDLWNAEATGTIRSAGGQLTWRCLVHADEPVIMIDTRGSGDLKDSAFEYIPANAQSPRAVRSRQPRQPANPATLRRGDPNGVQTAIQNLVSGGQTAVAWKVVRSDEGANTSQVIYLSVQHSFPESTAAASAVHAVETASAPPVDRWVSRHRAWWHHYYPLSFLSTGDPYWDAFYWVQQYKLGSATRDKGWIIDNQGPWLQPTAWNATWWNLNAQISHAGPYQANRRGQGSALSHRLSINRENLSLNVDQKYRSDSYGLGRSSSGWDLIAHSGQPGGRPPIDPRIGHETGNLLWALHNVDLEYRYWHDESLRDEVLYPLLVRAVNYYRHFLVEENDGQYHLPPTHSPEYRTVADCTYDLDLLHWGLNRLIELAEEKHQIDAQFEEPLLPKWKQISHKLTPVPTDETGRMIGRNTALTGGHRHWSHLLAVYPLRTLTPETSADRDLIETSLKHWRSFGRSFAGYSSTSAACMAAMLGHGNDAFEYLNGLKHYLRPNTMYSEAGNPVMETPLHGATAMQEMVLQSWGGTLRIFPAVPDAWTDVQFARFRGEGGFLVSARRSAGQNQWVDVFAENQGAVNIDCGFDIERFSADAGVTVQIHQGGKATVHFPANRRVQFFAATMPQTEPVINAIPARGQLHRFGLSGPQPER